MLRAARMRSSTLEPEGGEDIEGQVTSHGSSVYFYSAVSKRSVLTLVTKLHEAAAEALKVSGPTTEPVVHLYIHSEGGDLFAGLAAMRHIRNFPVKVVTIADGFVASAATLLLLGARKRYALPYANILVHQVRSGVWGKFDDIMDEAKNAKLAMRMIKTVYKEETNLTPKRLDALLRKELHLSVAKSIKLGFVHAIA